MTQGRKGLRNPATMLMAAALLLNTGGAAAAGEPGLARILPGDPSLQTDRLELHRATYVLYGVAGDARQRMQEIQRDVSFVERDGERLLRVAWATQAMGRTCSTRAGWIRSR